MRSMFFFLVFCFSIMLQPHIICLWERKENKMNTAKDLHFDVLMTDVRAQTQSNVFEILAKEAASSCGMDADILVRLFDKHADDRTFTLEEEGVVIFDVTSIHIKTPILAMIARIISLALTSSDTWPLT